MAARYGVTGGKAALAVLCIVLVCAAVVGVWFGGASGGVGLERSTAQESAADERAAAKSEPVAEKTIVVHVDGAVAQPGVFTLVDGSRVNDAVVAAGGLTEVADTSTTNLAAPLADGAKVHIPTSDELAAPVSVEGGGTTGATSASSSGLVNINTATSADLQTLSGVGEATAAAIIEDREANGPFTSPEDLMRVSGIGEKKYAKIKDHICV